MGGTPSKSCPAAAGVTSVSVKSVDMTGIVVTDGSVNSRITSCQDLCENDTSCVAWKMGPVNETGIPDCELSVVAQVTSSDDDSGSTVGVCNGF